jgi:hypothetical protein
MTNWWEQTEEESRGSEKRIGGKADLGENLITLNETVNVQRYGRVED